LEVEAEQLLSTGKTALPVALLGIVLPFVSGYSILLCWGRPTVESLFLGVAMVAISVAITVQVLSSLGVMHLPASRTIMAATVNDDVLGLIVLAVVSSMAKDDFQPFDLALTAVMPIGFTLAVVFYDSQNHAEVEGTMQTLARAKEVDFHLATVMLLGMGLLPLQTGVAAIIGAFLAGMALSLDRKHRVHDLTSGFRPESSGSLEGMGLVAIVAVAAVGSKVAGMSLMTTMVAPSLLKLAYRRASTP
jgi:Kef-type K+ transport system membrane component KefB